MSLAIQALTVLASVAVLIQAVSSINSMSKRTDHVVRLAHVMISSGAFAEMYSIFNGHTPSIEEALFVIGVGLLSIVDRRTGFRCQFTKEGG